MVTRPIAAISHHPIHFLGFLASKLRVEQNPPKFYAGVTGKLILQYRRRPALANDVDLSPRMPDASGDPGWITFMRQHHQRESHFRA
jgi:hypothetical protein